ncbi:MAG: glucose 1-dehydrogenase [Bacteroidota bacterium]
MEQRLRNKVGIVTGATSGMGRAIAQMFFDHGAKLVLSGRNVASGTALASTLPNTVFKAGDVCNADYNQQLVQTALETFGQVDIVSCNAGILGLGNVVDLPAEVWHKTLDTNVTAIYHLAKYALPHLGKTRGNLLVNASIAAFKSFPNHPAYCASKAAALALTKQLAVEYAPEVRVNALCPGPVDTPLLWDSAKAFENPDIAVKNAAEATLIKRLGSPEDVAQLALFLVSEEASWITGTAVTIDGGIINT